MSVLSGCMLILNALLCFVVFVVVGGLIDCFCFCFSNTHQTFTKAIIMIMELLSVSYIP